MLVYIIHIYIYIYIYMCLYSPLRHAVLTLMSHY